MGIVVVSSYLTLHLKTGLNSLHSVVLLHHADTLALVGFRERHDVPQVEYPSVPQRKRTNVPLI